MENYPFLIARRRNAQRIHGTDWVTRLAEATGVIAESIVLVEPEASVLREREAVKLLNDGLTTGAVLRSSGLSRDDVVRLWDAAVSSCGSEMLICRMPHHGDFSFSIRAHHLVGRLTSLLSFDGDTVEVSSPDLQKGLAVDMYEETRVTMFEVDRWGSW